MDIKQRCLLSGVYASVGLVFTALAKCDRLSKGASSAFLSLVWLGFVLAISCTESWIKFRVSFMPRHVALDLGRTMFAALNCVEIGLCFGLWVLHFAVVSSSDDAVWRLVIVTLLVVVQVTWLYPKLELTAEFVMYEELKELDTEKLLLNQKMQFGEMRHKVQIQSKPAKIYHILYTGGEAVKILTLVSYALHFLKAIPAVVVHLREADKLKERYKRLFHPSIRLKSTTSKSYSVKTRKRIRSMTNVDVDCFASEMGTSENDRLDVPGVVLNFMLMGSISHVMDQPLLKNLEVTCLIDAENPRKRLTHPEVQLYPTIGMDRIELDDDCSYDDFKSAIMKASKLIQGARSDNKTVFVFCTHGNNESAVVCIAYLMVVEQRSLERAYRHVLQKRPASAPRKLYVEKLRTLELETHGRVTLRSDQIGPSMIDIMLGLRGQSPINDMDEQSSPATDSGIMLAERASVMSNLSVTTRCTYGMSLCETVLKAEQGDEPSSREKKKKLHPHLSPDFGRKKSKGRCIIS